jgi:hypothetical protein
MSSPTGKRMIWQINRKEYLTSFTGTTISLIQHYRIVKHILQKVKNIEVKNIEVKNIEVKKIIEISKKLSVKE